MEKLGLDIKCRGNQNSPMNVEQFLNLLDYRPKHVTRLDDPCTQFDGVQMIEFRRKGDFTASIEFGNYFNKKMNGFYFYFEIVDWSGTSYGSSPITSSILVNSAHALDELAGSPIAILPFNSGLNKSL